jgi:UDP-N-acetylmuramoylalanine--D-glutamate ligase
MENITCVLTILHEIGIDIHDVKKILTNFCALPHRLEDVGTYHDIRFINDAISTTPESTIEAIKTYKESIGTIFL